jgi:predicted  nucleic acid-binding Zn-ribbon protein
MPQQPVQQQPKPLPQPPMQAVPLTTTTAASTTTTTLPAEAQVPSEINQVVGIQDPVPADVLSSEEPPVPIQSPKSSVTVEDVKSGNENEDDVGEDEEGEETEEIDPNEQTEDEVDDDDFILEKTPTDQLSLDIKEQENLDPVTESVKTPTIDPVIEIVDLHGVNSSPIHAPHIRSLEESIDNPLVMNNEQSTVVEMPISNKSEFIEESQGPGIVVETIPEEENVTHDSVRDAFDEPRASNTIAEEDGNASQPLNWLQDGQSEPVIETLSTDNEVKNVVVSSPISNDFEQFNETIGADVVPASETVVESITPGSETLLNSEIVVSTEIPQTPLEPVKPDNLLSEPELVQADVNLNQQPTELPADKEKIETVQELLPNKEDLLSEEIKPSEEPQQVTEEISQEPVTPSTDLNPESLPVDLKTISEDNKSPSPEGSGGGFIDSALNWLGLSDTDEPLKTDQVSVETTDPAPLLQQIASMDPTSNQEVEPAPKEVVPKVEEVNGFCDTQDCAKLVDGPDVTPKVDIHVHEKHAGDAGHVHLQNQEEHHHNHDDHHHDHTHDSHDSHDHHHHENDGHDHHGHGHGHGHSHIPGYIPGFGHHYKPPVAKPQVVPPPSEIPTPPPPLPTIVEIVPEKFPELQPAPELPTPPPVVEEFNPLPPVAVDEHLNQPASVLEQTPPPAVGSVPEEVPAKESTVPEYIPVEEIFRQEMEKNRLLQEKQQQQEQNGEGMFDWLTVSFTSLLTFVNDAESFDGVSKTSLYPALVVSVTTVAFLMLYYSVQNKSVEKLLKARISLLDSQLYESQSANEDSSSAQTKLSEYEMNAAELRSQKEQAEADKVALSRRLASLEKERDSLEKEVECATESATEANRMLEELLASQSENDQWQRSVEVLQQQLNRQQQTMESLNSSLCVKSAENETLVEEVEELRTESERYKVRIKTLQGDLENLKTSNRNYQQKMAQEGGELMKLKQEKEAWVSERRSLSSQINRHAKEVEEWRDKAEQLKKSIKAKENDLAKSIELLKQSGNDSPTVLQLTSLVQLESELNEANQTVERLTREVNAHSEESRRFETEKVDIQQRLSELQSTCEAAVKDKREAETRLEVCSIGNCWSSRISFNNVLLNPFFLRY